MNKVLVVVDVPEKYINKTKYIFNLFSLSWGLPIKISYDLTIKAKADIVYSKREKWLRFGNPIVIPFDDQLYDKHTKCMVIKHENSLFWGKSFDQSIIDLVASTYRLINFYDESEIKDADRDNIGRYKINSLPESRKESLIIPFIENHANVIFEALLRNKPHLENLIVPRWPNGKKYILSLTHDNDVVDIRSSSQLLRNSLKVLLGHERYNLKLLKDGLSYRGNFTDNPFFGFPGWQKYESTHNIRSCFYLFVKPQLVKTHSKDCRSDLFSEQTDWAILRQMAINNWEFGLHPAINAKDNVEEFLIAKNLLEQKLEVNLYGLRHHYWALDWYNPSLTLRKHAKAGFMYDSSIANRDGPGLRAGTCLPFQPYDPENDQPINIIELPVCLSDDHIIKGSNILEIVKEGKNIVDKVRQVGGVAVLNWHVETYCNSYSYENYLDVLEGILMDYLNDTDAWTATPLEIINWWQSRSLALLT